MNLALRRSTVSVCAFTLAVVGCASTYEGARSGFLPDNDYTLVKRESSDRYIYVSDKFTPANYNALIIRPLEFYPAPQPTDNVSADVLKQISDYTNQQMRTKIGAKVKVVDTPGPGVAEWKGAFTAVGEETRNLKVWQFLPIALVITGAVAVAQGGLPHDSSVAFENTVTDSVSHETLYVGIRGGTGERVPKGDEGQYVVKAEDLKPLIDQWVDQAAEGVTKFVAAK